MADNEADPKPATTEPAVTPAAEPPDAQMRWKFTLHPLASVLGDLAGLLGESAQTLVGMFYPVQIGKRANVVITELVTNVFENVYDPTSSFDMELEIVDGVLRITVTNVIAAEQYEKVRARIESVASAADAKKLLAKIIRERRPQRLKGGLGLTRLVAENRFALSSEYVDGRLTVRAEHVLKGNA